MAAHQHQRRQHQASASSGRDKRIMAQHQRHREIAAARSRRIWRSARISEKISKAAWRNGIKIISARAGSVSGAARHMAAGRRGMKA